LFISSFVFIFSHLYRHLLFFIDTIIAIKLLSTISALAMVISQSRYLLLKTTIILFWITALMVMVSFYFLWFFY